MELQLLVLRTSDPHQLSAFYSLLGMSFDYHQHGNGPFHYAATTGQMTLEIYPLAKGQQQADIHLRLGFSIGNFDQTIALLKEQAVSFLADPSHTDFGFRAIVADPDGRKIELYKNAGR